MINEIKKTLTNIISILHSNNENAWAKTFETLGSELDVDCEASIFALKKVYGGMGSFNDIVLHKNGQPLRKENDELEDLSHRLYQQLEQAIELTKKGVYPNTHHQRR
ncbi:MULTISPECIES: DUF6966 domain-containing protein [Enterobacter]|uniref:DUF6966 domain-containing protein n=1 Tax=Enterobacter kobei TaxID=208224 RepID=A0ABX9F2I1_9ENTR|nr:MULTISPECIES: hypothetical protein [Enterobacter]CAE7637158.1 hypothetical protein AI2762V1_4296 [Enterobacter cloacae]EKM5743598.1 hypothetical protein [Enterobacter kobei]EKS6749435.1 hypothetical protein [Enterobacter kobei]EKV5789072.1 hypothetical protein [Enterobacter kobei]ELC0997141.1 hypothetical protein [Enterobacter kobei]